MDKLKELYNWLKKHRHIAVAFSGGVDSSFLALAAKHALGAEHVLCVHARTPFTTSGEAGNAALFAQTHGLSFADIYVDTFAIEPVKYNHTDRCYHCKKLIFGQIIDLALAHGADIVLDGTNADDVSLYRPGLRALSELGVLSPLRDCCLYKKEIREALADFTPETASKPSAPCLATRFAYDTEITPQDIERVREGETLLEAAGYRDVRLRVHMSAGRRIVRLEISLSDFSKIVQDTGLVSQLVALGFDYITLDLQGFRSGSMDIGLT